MNKSQHIYAVFLAALIVTSVIAVVSIGAITAVGREDDGNRRGSGNIGVPGESASLDYKGCGAVWIILPNEDEAPVDVRIKIFNEQSGETEIVQLTITKDDLERVPGQYGDNPLFKFNVDDDNRDKIIAVAVEDSDFVDNPNRCADT